MGWFTADPPVDRKSDRWSIAVHEVAHLTVARVHGATERSAHFTASDGSHGRFDVTMPDVACTSADAVVHLAGGAGQRLISGRGGPSDLDMDQARKALRGTGMSLSRARAAADQLVRKHRPEIIRGADRLYRKGKI